MLTSLLISEKFDANFHRRYAGLALSLYAGKVGELLVTAIRPGGLQEALNDKDTEEK